MAPVPPRDYIFSVGMAVSAADRGLLYAAALGSLWRSADLGENWTRAEGLFRPTLLRPAEPVVFTLAPGSSGIQQFQIATDVWGTKIPVELSVASGNWMTAQLLDTATPARVSIRANTAGLAPGTYAGSLHAVSPQAANSPLTIPVQLVVADPASSGPRYIATRIAGIGTAGFSGDGGPATQAQLSWPKGLFLDSAGNLLVADSGNNRVRKITPEGVISTVAGSGKEGAGGDGGPALSAELYPPSGVGLDRDGNLYIVDGTRHTLRKVAPGGTISTMKVPLSAYMNLNPMSMGIDNSGNLVVAGTDGGTARVLPDGTVAPLSGDRFDFTSDLAFDSAGVLYAVEIYNHRVRRRNTDGKIVTVAGNGTSGYQGDGQAATSRRCTTPRARLWTRPEICSSPIA